MTIIVSTTAGNAPSTFLGLVQRLSIEAGCPGSTGSGPSTTIGQVGEFGRLVNWINDAWLDIQAMHTDWGWLRTNASLVTVAGQASYPMAQISNALGVPGLTDFGKWDTSTGRNYVTASGTASEVYMDEISYDEWRDMYAYGALRQTQTRSIQFAIAPADKSVVLGPYPAAGYTFTMDYFRAPSYMSLDTDVPLIPAQFRMAIVYRALQFYGTWEKDEGVIAQAKAECDRKLRQMNADYLPQMTTGLPIA